MGPQINSGGNKLAFQNLNCITPQVQGGHVEVFTWVSFHFESNGEPVIPFLETSLNGVREIIRDLHGA